MKLWLNTIHGVCVTEAEILPCSVIDIQDVVVLTEPEDGDWFDVFVLTESPRFISPELNKSFEQWKEKNVVEEPVNKSV